MGEPGECFQSPTMAPQVGRIRGLITEVTSVFLSMKCSIGWLSDGLQVVKDVGHFAQGGLDLNRQVLI